MSFLLVEFLIFTNVISDYLFSIFKNLIIIIILHRWWDLEWNSLCSENSAVTATGEALWGQSQPPLRLSSFSLLPAVIISVCTPLFLLCFRKRRRFGSCTFCSARPLHFACACCRTSHVACWSKLSCTVAVLSIIQKSFQNSIFKGTFVILIRVRDG